MERKLPSNMYAAKIRLSSFCNALAVTRSGELRYFEALIHVKVARGVPVGSELVAVSPGTLVKPLSGSLTRGRLPTFYSPCAVAAVLPPGTMLAHDDIQDWNEDQVQRGRGNHSAEDRRANGNSARPACTLAPVPKHDAQNERE